MKGNAKTLTFSSDRLVAALAVTVTYDRRTSFDDFLSVLVDIYRSLMDRFGTPRHASEAYAAQMMLRIAVGVEAVGGLAVRLRQLWAVRPLAMPSKQLIAQIREPSWTRHSITMAARAGQLYLPPLPGDNQPRAIGGPVVALARQLVERLPALRPDTQVPPFELNSAPQPHDPVLDSLIQFDVLWCVIAVANSGHESDHYPSFSSFFASRAEPAFELLVQDEEAREALLGDDTARLAPAMRAVIGAAGRASLSEYRRPWHFDSDPVDAFLRDDSST